MNIATVKQPKSLVRVNDEIPVPHTAIACGLSKMSERQRTTIVNKKKHEATYTVNNEHNFHSIDLQNGLSFSFDTIRWA